eukprot:gene3183-3707_t
MTFGVCSLVSVTSQACIVQALALFSSTSLKRPQNRTANPLIPSEFPLSSKGSSHSHWSALLGTGYVTSTTGCLSWHQFAKALTNLGAARHHVSEAWVQCQCRTVYLLFLTRVIAAGPDILTAEEMLSALIKRYQQEYTDGFVSPVRGIMQGDLPAAHLSLCLLIVSCEQTPGRSPRISNATPSAPLDSAENQNRLDLSINSLWPAPSMSPLGILPNIQDDKLVLPVRRLHEVHADGGDIPMVDVVISSKYPMLYLDKSSGTTCVRNALAEEEERRAHERRVHERRERVLLSKAASSGTANDMADLSIYEVRDPALHSLLKLMNASADPEAYLLSLPSHISQQLLQYRENLVANHQQKCAQQIEQALAADDLHKDRSVTPFFSLRVSDYCCPQVFAIITVWNPPDGLFDMLREGFRIRCLGLRPAKKQIGNFINLCGNRSSRIWQAQLSVEDLVSGKFPGKFAIRVESLLNRAVASGDEFDTVGLVLHVSRQTSFVHNSKRFMSTSVYVCNDSAGVLCIQIRQTPTYEFGSPQFSPGDTCAFRSLTFQSLRGYPPQGYCLATTNDHSEVLKRFTHPHLVYLCKRLPSLTDAVPVEALARVAEWSGTPSQNPTCTEASQKATAHSLNQSKNVVNSASAGPRITKFIPPGAAPPPQLHRQRQPLHD